MLSTMVIRTLGFPATSTMLFGYSASQRHQLGCLVTFSCHTGVGTLADNDWLP
jgi:hypothetical protein